MCAGNGVQTAEAAQGTLPSPRAIAEVLHDFRVILYPLLIGRADVSHASLKLRLTARLDRAQTTLREQIWRGLTFGCGHRAGSERGAPCTACAARATGADIGQITRLLTTIESQHERLGPDPGDEPESFVDHLAHLSVDVHYDIVFKLQDLEKLTKEDKIVWRLGSTDGMSVDDDHPQMSALKAGVASTCFVADFEGRTLVILYVPGYSESDPHVLACLRDGKKLSRLLWPPPYESNNISAAIDSVKKHTPHAFDPEADRDQRAPAADG